MAEHAGGVFKLLIRQSLTNGGAADALAIEKDGGTGFGAERVRRLQQGKIATTLMTEPEIITDDEMLHL